MNGYQYALRRVKWQLFVTLTRRAEKLSVDKRLTSTFSLLREVSDWYRIHFLELFWVIRLEAGELNGRWHEHVLIAGLPTAAQTDRSRFAISRSWLRRRGGGYGDVRNYDPFSDCVGYVLKDLEDDSIRAVRLAGQNEYETGKFGGAHCEVMVSKSVLRHQKASVRKWGRAEDRKQAQLDR